MFYHRPLTNLRFDQEIFSTLLEFGKDEGAPWKRGYDQNGALWNIEELPVRTEEFPILNEIYQGFQAEFKRPSFFLSRVLPGGLVNHVDHRKWGNLAIPLEGEFSDSPIRFLDPFNHVLEEFYFEKTTQKQFIPVLFNTRMTHAVPLPETSNRPRIVLMMDVFEWPDNLFKKIDDGEIWQNTEHFELLNET